MLVVVLKDVNDLFLDASVCLRLVSFYGNGGGIAFSAACQPINEQTYEISCGNGEKYAEDVGKEGNFKAAEQIHKID